MPRFADMLRKYVGVLNPTLNTTARHCKPDQLSKAVTCCHMEVSKDSRGADCGCEIMVALPVHIPNIVHTYNTLKLSH